ncbi:MAG: electron transport complex subunit RsxC [Alkaliphilus sp.]
MKQLTFKGGIHPPYSKELTSHLETEKANVPNIVAIPISQHIGAPCNPIVKVGDRVLVGEKIGEAGGFVSSPIHASVSGTVKAIKDVPSVMSGEVLSIIIESDGTNEIHPSVLPKGKIETLSSKEIIEIVKEAGIVGMGGATFPTHVKLSPPPDKKIDTFILNGAECEPYLTDDHRLMLEEPEDIVYGLRVMMKAVDADKAFIGIEDNKQDAIEAMIEATKDFDNIEVVTCETKYPQGSEKQLIYACVKKEVPSGKLPMDVGVVVNNVGTAAQVAKTIKTGMPLIERITTISGSAVKTPRNLLLKIGVPIKEVIEQCGGYTDDVGKIIMGGPMMGLAQHTDEVVITKGSSGIVVLNTKEAKAQQESQCIRCGTCVEQCPSFIEPLHISSYTRHNAMDLAEEYCALDCIECGTCSFGCPAKIPLLQAIRVAKQHIIAKRRR